MFCVSFLFFACSKHNRTPSLHSHSHQPHRLSDRHISAEVEVAVPEALPALPPQLPPPPKAHVDLDAHPAPSIVPPTPHVELDPQPAPSLPPPKPHVKPDPEPDIEPHIVIKVPEEPYVTENNQ